MENDDNQSIQQDNDNNTIITSTNKIRACSSWNMTPVLPNPECVEVFFKNLELKGETLQGFANKKQVNRSKLSQILHGLNVPRTPMKRKFWAEEILGFDVQLFWIPENDSQQNKQEVKENGI